MKYSCEKIEDNKSYVWHTEGETKTLIAVTDTLEKSHFLSTAANNFSTASLPSSSVTGEEWISLKEYEQKAVQLLADKPVIKMLVQNGLPFEKWGNNIHNLIDKELGATRELRVKMPSSVTGESEAIDWEQVFENAQSMHLQEFINYYKQSKK